MIAQINGSKYTQESIKISKTLSAPKPNTLTLPKFKDELKKGVIHTQKRISKTEKNDSPPKIKLLSLKKILNNKEESCWKQQSIKNYFNLSNCKSNQTKIKFKTREGDMKKMKVQKKDELKVKRSFPWSKETMVVTPLCCSKDKMPLSPTTEHSLQAKERGNYLSQPQQYKEYLEQAIKRPSKALTREEHTFLQTLVATIANVHRHPNQITLYELFLTADKHKLEKKLFSLYPSHRTSIFLTRFVLYSLAYSLVLQTVLQKPLLATLPKIFVLYSALASPKRKVDVEQTHTSIRLCLISVWKKLGYQQLLFSLLQTAMHGGSFEDLLFIDKTLKWELLGMPTPPFLPPSLSSLPCLVLDLDETLVHYASDQETFHIRPYAEQFLSDLAIIYEIVIFTAATKDYADQVLNEIDPLQKHIAHRLYRNHLTYLAADAVKDMSLLGRPLDKLIIVDNLAHNFKMQPQNGIHIRSWYASDDDQILLHLTPILKNIAQNYASDLRKGIKFHSLDIQSKIM